MTRSAETAWVYFIEDGSEIGIIPAGITPFVSDSRIWILGFPFDCILVKGSGKKFSAEQLSDILSVELTGRSVGIKLSKEEPISVRMGGKATAKSNTEKDIAFLLNAAVQARFEEAKRLLRSNREWLLSFIVKYGVVKTLQLPFAGEVRMRHDLSLARFIRLGALRSWLNEDEIRKKEWGGLPNWESVKSDLEAEDFDSLAEEWEPVQESLSDILERISEKKFLVWEMIAEYTIVVLILMELVVAALDFLSH